MALFNCKTKSNELTQLHARPMCNIHDKRHDAIGPRSNGSLFVIWGAQAAHALIFANSKHPR